MPRGSQINRPPRTNDSGFDFWLDQLTDYVNEQPQLQYGIMEQSSEVSVGRDTGLEHFSNLFNDGSELVSSGMSSSLTESTFEARADRATYEIQFSSSASVVDAETYTVLLFKNGSATGPVGGQVKFEDSGGWQHVGFTSLTTANSGDTFGLYIESFGGSVSTVVFEDAEFSMIQLR